MSVFADFWSSSASRGIHTEDAPHIVSRRVVNWTLAEATAQASSFERNKSLHPLLHTNLFPQPFIGNLRSASVYILFGNPGFGTGDYLDELDNESHAKACRSNLQTAHQGFFPLLPPSVGTGAANYWRPRLRFVASELVARLGLTATAAAEFLIQRLCVIEGGAYHSRSHPGVWADALPSSRVVRDFVRCDLVPKAKRGDVMLFIWRRASYWNVVESSEHILVRHPNKARHSYLFDAERKAIVSFLAARGTGA